MTTTPPATEEPSTRSLLRHVRLSSADVVAAGGVAAIGAAFLLSPDHIEDGPVLCPFRAVTGLPCPGCGLTRSWVYGAHGWWPESFSANPFGLVALAAVVTFVVLVVVRRARRLPPPSLDKMLRHPVAIGLGAIWLGYGLIRLALAI